MPIVVNNSRSLWHTRPPPNQHVAPSPFYPAIQLLFCSLILLPQSIQWPAWFIYHQGSDDSITSAHIRLSRVVIPDDTGRSLSLQGAFNPHCQTGPQPSTRAAIRRGQNASQNTLPLKTPNQMVMEPVDWKTHRFPPPCKALLDRPKGVINDVDAFWQE